MNSIKKRAGVIALSLAMVAPLFTTMPASADTAIALNAAKGTIYVGKSKTVKIKNIKKKDIAKMVVVSRKESVATVKKINEKRFTVTGKKAGKAYIIAKIKLKRKINGLKVYKFKYVATVKANTPAVTTTPVTSPAVTLAPSPSATPAAALTTVTQTASNAITLAFNMDVSSQVKKDSVKVVSKDDSLQIPINTLTFAKDGKTADAILANNLLDGKEYVVSYGTSQAGFTASCGEVASVSLVTTEAEQFEVTPIKFKLLDAKGIDVSPSIPVNTTVLLNVSGKYSQVDKSVASKATLTMINVGDVCTVEIVYNANKTGSVDIKGSGTITCISPRPKTGTPIFYQGTDINTSSNCAKFYKGLSSSEVKVAAGSSTDIDSRPTVYFYAKDTDGSAISYDTYTVSSSNNDVMNVTVQNNSGKYASMTVTGNKAGTANINIQATKNGVSTPYVIPVTVTEPGRLSSVEVEVTRPNMSNTYDKDYFGEIKVKALDASGNVISSGLNINYSIVEGMNNSGTNRLDPNAVTGLGGTSSNPPSQLTGFRIDGSKYTAYGADTGTYTIQVDVGETSSDKVISKRAAVNITCLPVNAWCMNSDSGISVSYAVELKKDEFDEAVKDDYSTTARLCAMYGYIFLGYVDKDGNIGEIDNYGAGQDGAIQSTNATRITDISAAVSYGSSYTGNQDSAMENGFVKVPLYNSTVNMTNKAPSVGNPTINSTDLQLDLVNDDESGRYCCLNDPKLDTYYARPGNYSVIYTYNMNGKASSVTHQFSVKNTTKAPEITVDTTYVKSLTGASVVEVMNASVDLNNSTSDHASITAADIKSLGLDKEGKLTKTSVTATSGLFTVNYAAVVEDDVTYYVPVNTSFMLN